jgi:hypothetical protein
MGENNPNLRGSLADVPYVVYEAAVYAAERRTRRWMMISFILATALATVLLFRGTF